MKAATSLRRIVRCSCSSSSSIKSRKRVFLLGRDNHLSRMLTYWIVLMNKREWSQQGRRMFSSSLHRLLLSSLGKRKSKRMSRGYWVYFDNFRKGVSVISLGGRVIIVLFFFCLNSNSAKRNKQLAALPLNSKLLIVQNQAISQGIQILGRRRRGFKFINFSNLFCFLFFCRVN